MTATTADALWSRHHAAWRDTAQVASQWQDARAIDPETLRHNVSGAFWELLAESHVTLLVTREYEHLVMALCAGPSVTFLPLPHPSGMAVDRSSGIVHIASTRNPNQVYDLRPVTDLLPRMDVKPPPVINRGLNRPLVPAGSRFYPGCMYMHDLALIGGRLYANAVGQNAVARLGGDGRYERVWWPRCIETKTGPVFGRNHLQLNSIAAGPTLRQSYFSASTDKVSARRPGMRNFPVDGRGVIFAGRTREVFCRGLTRPHSGATLRRQGLGGQQRLRRTRLRRRWPIPLGRQAAGLDPGPVFPQRHRLRGHVPSDSALPAIRSGAGRGWQHLRRPRHRSQNWPRARQPDLAGRQPDFRHRLDCEIDRDGIPVCGRDPTRAAREKALFYCYVN